MRSWSHAQMEQLSRRASEIPRREVRHSDSVASPSLGRAGERGEEADEPTRTRPHALRRGNNRPGTDLSESDPRPRPQVVDRTWSESKQTARVVSDSRRH